jgi:HAD superfamily hydrolase (TIGR01509 family)
MRKLMLKVKAVIFDLDGTLVDATEAYLEAAKVAFASSGRKKNDKGTAAEIPRRFEQDMPIDDLIAGADVERFKEIYLKAFYRATAEKTKPFPDVASTLEKLSSKVKLAVTTRRRVPQAEVKRELVKLGLAEHIQEIITSQDTAKPKPSPEALIKCATRLDVKISDCAMVGDSVVDVRAGKNAQAHTVAVLSGIFSREELEREKPDLVLRSVKELPELLA